MHVLIVGSHSKLNVRGSNIRFEIDRPRIYVHTFCFVRTDLFLAGYNQLLSS